MQLSPLLAELSQYPFARLDEWRAGARARGLEVIDFGLGDPREPTPAFVREALVAGLRTSRRIRGRSGCPSTVRRSQRGSRGGSASRRIRTSRSCRRSGRRRRSSRSRRWRSASGGSLRCRSRRTRFTSEGPCLRARRWCRFRCARIPRGYRTSTRSISGTRSGSSGRATRTIRPARRRRFRSTRSSPASRASTGSCSAPTRRTRSSGSARSPCRRSR